MASEAELAETGHVVSEHAQGMPQLNFATFPNQWFWLIVTLGVLYLVLSRVVLPRIASVLSERQNAMARDLEAAEGFKQQAVDAEDAYNAALTEARAEAGRIVAEAKADIQQDLDKAIARADADIAVKAKESEGKINDIRDSTLKSVEVVAKATAAEIIKAVLPGTGDAKAVTAAVKSHLQELDG